MPVRSALYFLVAALLVAGHAWGGDDVVEPGQLCEGVTNAIGITPDDTIKKLGKPASREVTPVDNRYVTNARDAVIEIRYPDSGVSFRYLSEPNRYLLLHANLSERLFTDELRKTISKTRRELANKWGQANETTDSYVRYYCTFEMLEWMDVMITSGQVTGLTYTGYID